MAQYLSIEQRIARLESVLLEVKRISEAPSYCDLEEKSYREKIPLEEVLAVEREQLYKAIDNFGTIYMTHNPAARKFIPKENSRGCIVHPAPNKVDFNSEQPTRSGSAKVEQTTFF